MKGAQEEDFLTNEAPDGEHPGATVVSAGNLCRRTAASHVRAAVRHRRWQLGSDAKDGGQILHIWRDEEGEGESEEGQDEDEYWKWPCRRVGGVSHHALTSTHDAFRTLDNQEEVRRDREEDPEHCDPFWAMSVGGLRGKNSSQQDGYPLRD